MREPRQRLLDIVEAIDAIQRYTAAGRDRFDREELVQVWVVRHLQIIGEAASRLPEDLRVRAPEIPWPQVIGMRHVLVHGYFDIDTEIVWQTVEWGLPPLRTAAERLLAERENDTA